MKTCYKVVRNFVQTEPSTTSAELTLCEVSSSEGKFNALSSEGFLHVFPVAATWHYVCLGLDYIAAVSLSVKR